MQQPFKTVFIFKLLYCLVVVQSLNHDQLFMTPWTAACQAYLSFTISQSLFKLMSIELMMPSNHLILCHLLLLLPSIFPSIRVFSELALHIRWPKYWSFSFSISPSNECSGLISFRIDWLDLLAVQDTLKSILQCHSSKASILWHSAFFMVFKSFLLEYSLELYPLMSFCFCSFLLWLQVAIKHKISWDEYQTGCKFSGNRKW